jgi:3-dehydroshikimate dehydratase
MRMIRPGLVSVTFRKLTPKEVVDLAGKAGLTGIEWGGDIHVPHGDLTRAREVRDMSRDAGIAVAAYGSYYTVGHDDPAVFGGVLASAIELNATLIRVWAGKKGSAAADSAYRAGVIGDSQRIANLAAKNGITITYEFHRGTLTDTDESAIALLKEVGRPNVKSYWQPPIGLSTDACLASLDKVMPWLTHVHMFHWVGPKLERRPFAEGVQWKQYLAKVAATGRDHFAMFEFVQDDSPEALLRDAAALKEWLAEIQP